MNYGTINYTVDKINLLLGLVDNSNSTGAGSIDTNNLTIGSATINNQLNLSSESCITLGSNVNVNFGENELTHIKDATQSKSAVTLDQVKNLIKDFNITLLYSPTVNKFYLTLTNLYNSDKKSVSIDVPLCTSDNGGGLMSSDTFKTINKIEERLSILENEILGKFSFEIIPILQRTPYFYFRYAFVNETPTADNVQNIEWNEIFADKNLFSADTFESIATIEHTTGSYFVYYGGNNTGNGKLFTNFYKEVVDETTHYVFENEITTDLLLATLPVINKPLENNSIVGTYNVNYILSKELKGQTNIYINYFKKNT